MFPLRPIDNVQANKKEIKFYFGYLVR